MSDMSYFESRKGMVSSSAKEFYIFVTDLRNFERFVPEKSVKNWLADKELCTFNVPMAGTIKVRIAVKSAYTLVSFEGDALNKNDFLLSLLIDEKGDNLAEVQISLKADLNPMLKMMASKPIEQFLEMMIVQMENFREWGNVTV